MKRDEQKVVGEREKRNLLYWEGFWRIFFLALPIGAQGKSLCFPFCCSVQELLPECIPNLLGGDGQHWHWDVAVGRWRGLGAAGAEVTGRAASSVSPLVSIGIVAMSSSQAAREAVWGRDSRAGEPGGASLPRSWLH